jgi:hypothetical protein
LSQGTPLFEAFTGLSYTTFNTTCTQREEKSSDTDASTAANNITMVLSCIVHNLGDRDGDAVVLVFHRPPSAPTGDKQRPIRRLLDFDRVHVPAGGSAPAHDFRIVVPQQLMLLSESGELLKVPGVHVLEVLDGPSYQVHVNVSS